MTPADPLATTRSAWHRVAEHVLAAAQYAATGTIRLRIRPGGFATTAGLAGRQLAVEGDRLVVEDGDGRRTAALTTLRAAADVAGVPLGLSGSYSPATDADPDAPLTVDPAAAGVLADWFALGDTALRRFTADLGEEQQPVLWPEHFDLAVTVDAVNYGCSPGDEHVPAPYLYVGPHRLPPPPDPFWNAPFGAAVTADRITHVEDALAFFTAGRARL